MQSVVIVTHRGGSRNQTTKVMRTTEKNVKVVEIERTPNYESNYDRNCYAEYICECCGKKLNPKTMKQVQMLNTGEWTDEQMEIPCENDERYDADGQGFFYVGPDCYRTIMARLAASRTTRKTRVITCY